MDLKVPRERLGYGDLLELRGRLEYPDNQDSPAYREGRYVHTNNSLFNFFYVKIIL